MASTASDTEQVIEAAFSQAFSPPPSRRQSVLPTAKAPTPTSEPTTATAEEPVVVEQPESAQAKEEEAWNQEYEEHLKVWRAQSAEAREKAEKVREEWEAKRAAEREEAAKRKAAGIPEPEPEVIPGPSTMIVVPPGPVDVPDLVFDEPQGHLAASTISQPDTVDGSQKWEEINSTTTYSYPSISFPDQLTPPLEHRHLHHSSHRGTVPPPPTATLSVFDTSLSTRTRLKALASSIAINLFLPFVNGVMLGFGEIFAKNFVLHWIGWGSTATNVGISRGWRKAS